MIKINKKNIAGLTLLELVMAIIIVAILAIIALPRYTHVVNKKRGEACMQNIKIALTAWRRYDLTHPVPFYNGEGCIKTLDEINNTLGISILERYFGGNDNNGNPIEAYYLAADHTGGEVAEFGGEKGLRVTARSFIIPGTEIYGYCYYDRNDNIWEWDGTWLDHFPVPEELE